MSKQKAKGERGACEGRVDVEEKDRRWLKARGLVLEGIELILGTKSLVDVASIASLDMCATGLMGSKGRIYIKLRAESEGRVVQSLRSTNTSKLFFVSFPSLQLLPVHT